MRPTTAWYVLLLITLLGCNDRPANEVTEETLPDHILSHTTGTISRNATITVTFDTIAEGAATPTISFAPSIDGESSFSGRRLVFLPYAPLPGGTDYVATVTFPDRSDYQFSFNVPARQLSLLSDGYYIPDANRPERVQLTGRLLTNDGASSQELADIISVDYAGSALPVELEPQGENAFSYTATIPDRGSQPSVATINVAGKGAFAGAATSRKVAIKPVGSFELTEVGPAPDGGSIVARFSGPVKERQDLTGLLRFRPAVPFTTSVDGNLINIFPQSTTTQQAVLLVDPQLASSTGTTLGQASEWQLTLGSTKPALRTVGSGTIVPHEGQRLFPFEAIGLSEVYVEIFRISKGNVLQYLQDGTLSSESQEWALRRVGTLVDRRLVPLDQLAATANQRQWTRYALDLGDYIANDDAAIYQIRIGFGMEQTLESCRGERERLGLPTIASRLDDDGTFNPGFAPLNSLLAGYYGVYGYDFWENREDPCSPAYYNRDQFIIQNFLSSNLGLIAKRNPDRSTLIFSTNLIDGGPQAGVKVTAYTYDQRELSSGSTDDQGKLSLTTEEEPGFLIASQDQQTAYLSLQEGEALPLGRFDVGGGQAVAGISGAFFAERGVWRPGDTVFLNFVLQDRAGVLPDDYPIEFTLSDARGRTVERSTARAAFDSGLYPLTFTTDAIDPTGVWTATVKAGGQTYTRNLLIERVKPNRLSIELNSAGSTNQLALSADWLYGAPAAGLRATIMATPRRRRVDFSKFSGFSFQDPARQLTDPEEFPLYDGRLNANGEATVSLPAPEGELPGPLEYRLATRVYEPGGAFSIDNGTAAYDPFSIYAGVRLPQDEWGSNRINTERGTEVEVASVTPTGQPVANRRLSVGIYRVNYRYWWQDGNDNVARFSSNRHTEAVSTLTATTGANGLATVPIEIDSWGRYLIRVCDPGGHCTGEYFYAGYGGSGEDERQSASLLHLTADRQEVSIGNAVNVEVPTSAGGQLLVSLETSVGSIEQFWVPTAAGKTTVNFRTDERMVPTVYANVTYLQPYAQTTNDRPVRLFGIVPVEVTDPQTLLQPVIETADRWQPGEAVSVTVSEAANREMTYVLAVVDEGLLGLTRFTTPDLHGDFFAKEALAVSTYDLYDHVMSSINGEFGRVLAIGGDGTEVSPEEASANRFEPVVRHLGPFHLTGGEQTHTLTLPNYLGAVRIMAVAVGKRAYGSDEATVTVNQPLMVLPTLPRVLGPGETIDMPVNVMAMESSLGKVNVDVSESSGLVSIPSSVTSLSFTSPGDQLTYFPLQVGQQAGIARVQVAASSGGQRSSQDIEIDVRQPNTSVTRSTTVSIPAGESRTIDYTPFGVPGSEKVTAELSALPAMQLGRHLDYLLHYPYGCAEQAVSAAFAQLYLDRVMELTPAQEAARKANVQSGLAALRQYRTGSGGIAYWPGQQRVHPWVTNYVLHFITEADRAGFGIPTDLQQDLLRFQQSAASSWTSSDGAFYASLQQRGLDQAYRLYTLALAERADIGAMNRLRGLQSSLSPAAAYQLAAAYALAGRPQTGEQITADLNQEVRSYRELGYTFGSQVRDMAIILAAEIALDDRSAADAQALRLARAVGERNWLSTQEAAFTFIALGKLEATTAGQPVKAEFTSPRGQRSTVGVASGIYSLDLPTDGPQQYTVRNTGSSTLYLTTLSSGIPPAGEEVAQSTNLRLSVSYTDLNGRYLDVGTLPSGTEFVATYTVTNPGTTGSNYRQLALNALAPSGWEVTNERLAGDEQDGDSYEYRDYDDDGVNTFFDLDAGATKTFRFRFTATYPGRYYLPTQVSEAMYDETIRAAVPGRWVEVNRAR